MRTTQKILGIITVLFVFTSCVFNGVKGNGNVVTDERTITQEFDAIYASAGIDVYVAMSQDVTLKVEADENLQDIIITEVRDGALHVYLDKNVWNSSTTKVYLTTPKITEIRTTSGSSVISEGKISAEELKLSATSGSDIKLEIEAEDVSCSTSSGADVKLSGTATSFEVNSSSGSDVKAENLITEICNASASSGADIDVHVTDNLTANANSGADIRYTGHPKTVSVDENSSGNVHN